MNDFEKPQSAGSVENLAPETEQEAEKASIQDESKSISGEFVGEGATDSIVRLLENSKLELASLKDSVFRTEKGANFSIAEISDSIVRIGELTEAAIGEISDTVVRIKAGSNVKVKRANNCMFYLAEGATLNIEENIDSIVRNLGEYTQNKDANNGETQMADDEAKKLADIREKMGQLQ